MQVDFGAPDGAMARQGKDMTAVPAALANAVLLADAARAAGVPLIFVRLLGRPQDGLCVEGTRGADFIGPLAARRRCHHLQVPLQRLRQYRSGRATARSSGIDTLVLAGLTTECCIQASAWAAFELDFQVVLAADACAAYEEDLHRHALKALELSGATLASQRRSGRVWKNSLKSMTYVF